MIESQEQKRMKTAFEMVEHVMTTFGTNNKQKWDDYHSRVQSAPVLIHDAGLMQTLAFYLSKNEDHIQLLARHLMGWIDRRELWQNDFNRQRIKQDNWNLYRRLSGQSMDQQMMNTRWSQALLKWLKRFSSAQLKQE